MTADPWAPRIAAVVDYPHELAAYREWLVGQTASGPRDYLFTEKRSRFEPRREDQVVLLDELSVTQAKDTTVLRCAEQSVTIPVPDVSVEDARRIIEVIDGNRCLLEVQLDAEVPAMVLALFLRAAFGRVVLAPTAVDSLESRVSGLEIARFPSPPYGVMRPYWNNMAEVRERIDNRDGKVPEGADWVRWLRELHVVALMGERLNSFYKPASPGADTRVSPGALFTEDVAAIDTPSGALMLSGPRVNAKLIGGEGYHAALYGSVADREALTRDSALEADGLSWGRVAVGRSERDPERAPWFLPPRPLTDAHFDVIRNHLRHALAGGDAAVEAAARMHWCFVRLHPFRAGNQSLAMSLANAALREAAGAGIPHLVLDHFALRLTQDAYATLFDRAVRAYAIPGAPVARVTELIKRNEASYAFIGKLTQAASALKLARENPDGARYALFLG